MSNSLARMNDLLEKNPKAAAWLLSEGTDSFKDSLMDQWLRKGFLSPKQLAAAERNADRVDKPKADPKEQVQRETFPKIMAFLKTIQGLKNPSFKIPNGDGVLRIKLMTHGNHEGNIFVDRGAFGTGVGKIDQNHDLIKYRSMTDEDLATLKKVEENPMDEIQAAGKQLGICMICSRELENEESVERGIGPICWARLGMA